MERRGCGFASQPVEPGSTPFAYPAPGGFTLHLPEGQAPGSCTLDFATTLESGGTVHQGYAGLVLPPRPTGQ